MKNAQYAFSEREEFGTPNNTFNKNKLVSFIRQAKQAGYSFYTLKDYYEKGIPDTKAFVLRLDLDFRPQMMSLFNNLIEEEGITFTAFVRTSGPYNFTWYPNFSVLDRAARLGAEIGLHSNVVEWASINGRRIHDVFSAEMSLLKNYFDVYGFAAHRDIHYMYNALPWVEKNWDALKAEHGLLYQAYDKKFFDNSLYLNEGLSPHLGWRSKAPEEIIPTGRSIYMLLHPHWWHTVHPFEMG